MNYLIHLLVVIAIYVMLGQALNLVVGFCGRLALCAGAFYGIGAFTAGLLMVHRGWGYLPATAVAVSSSAVMALFTGLPALRLRDDFFVLATIGFQIVVFSVLYNCVNVTGGPYGLAGIPRPTLLGVSFATPIMFLTLSIVLTTAVCLLCWQLARSPFGRVLRAIRDDDIAAASLGKNPVFPQLTAFTIFGAIAALAGTLWACWVTYIDPTNFTLDEAVFILAIVLIGGPGSLIGPIAGAVLMVLLPEAVRLIGVPEGSAANLRQIIYGMFLLLIMRFRREGLFGGYAIE